MEKPPKSKTFIKRTKKRYSRITFKSKRSKKQNSDKRSKTLPPDETFLKFYRLPDRFPAPFTTLSQYTNCNKEVIPLLHRDTVERVLVDLYESVKPILKKFKLNCSALVENHPILGAPAASIRVSLDKLQANSFTHFIKLRIRNPKTPNDKKKFFNKTTLLAVLFHEVAHIRHMSHGKKFMLFLRDIFNYARRFKILPKGEEHQMPSCREWEKLIFSKRGNISDEELLDLL